MEQTSPLPAMNIGRLPSAQPAPKAQGAKAHSAARSPHASGARSNTAGIFIGWAACALHAAIVVVIGTAPASAPKRPCEVFHKAHPWTSPAAQGGREPAGRQIYSQRIATVEPVFANIRHNKRLDRFILRGKEKVGTQWRLYCLVHNIEKLARSGYR